ncbi:hypothetical protein OAS19_06110 [Altererythrobacter sp.]|nr:hypothetical protein [Altererythrobacter sp.]
MSMTIEVARLRITREMRDAEVTLDEALMKQSSLLTTMVLARRETGSAPFEGHEALLRLHSAQRALLASGGNLARVHSKMLDIQREKSIIHDCPPNEPMGFEERESDVA